MKIASWNVNSLNVRLGHVVDWVRTAAPDVLALQETKLTDEKFPLAELEAEGYHCHFAGQKTYNGVALLSREPGVDPLTDIDTLEDSDRRIIAATYGDVRVLNLYVVNGKTVGDPKYDYKLYWLDQVTAFVRAQLKQYPKMVIVGDFNITPDDRDVHDPVAWRDKILCSAPERDALNALLAAGFHDSFRMFEQDAGHFSWWDYRAAAFRRKMGLRIDLCLVSDRLKDHVTAAGIDVEPRRWERPSDHTPVYVELGQASL